MPLQPAGASGRDALARGSLDLALDLLDDYLAVAPLGTSGEQAELDRVRVLARSGDRSGAVQAVRQFLTQWPGSGSLQPATFALGALLFSGGRYQDALPVLKQYQARWPEAHIEQVAYGLGWGYQALGDYPEAERWFRLGLERAPQGAYAAQARLGLADTYWQWGRLLAAAQAYSAVGRQLNDQDLRDRGSYLAGEAYSRQQNWEAAIGQFRQIAPNRPWAQRAQYALAYAYLQSGKVADAWRTLKTWLGTYANHAWKGSASYLGGLALMQLGDFPEAAKLFEQSWRTEPNGTQAAVALYGLAQAEYRLAKYASTVERCRELARRYPNSATAAAAKELLGEALYQQGHYQAAIQHLGDPQIGGSGKRALGFAYYRAGEFLAALQAWADFRDADVQFYRAQAHLAAGQVDESAKAFSAFLQANPTSPRVQEALFGLGSALARSGKYQEAISPLSEAEHAARPEIARAASLLLADCLVALQRYGAAREALGRFAAASPEAAGDSAYKMGWTYLQEGQGAKAVEAWQAFRLSHPRHRRVPDALYQEGLIALANKSYSQAAKLFADAVAHPGSRPDLRGEALLKQAEATIGSGDNALAAALYDQVRQSYPAFQDAATRGWLQTLSDASDLERAVRAVRQQIEEAPKSTTTHQAIDYLGQKLVVARRFSDAIDLLSQHPKPLAGTLYWLGRAQRGAGRVEQAATTLTRLVEAREGYEHAALDQLGQLAYVDKAYAKAAAYWQQLLDREPPATPSLQVQTRFNLALALSGAGFPDKAEATFRELAADPQLKPEQRLEALKRLAAWLREGKRLADAAKVYEQLAKQAPQPSLWASEAQYWLGHTLASSGAKADAIKALERVGPLTPGADQRWWVQALFKQGELYEETGKWKLAVTSYQKITTLKTDDNWRADAQARVRWIQQNVPAKELK